MIGELLANHQMETVGLGLTPRIRVPMTCDTRQWVCGT